MNLTKNIPLYFFSLVISFIIFIGSVLFFLKPYDVVYEYIFSLETNYSKVSTIIDQKTKLKLNLWERDKTKILINTKRFCYKSSEKVCAVAKDKEDLLEISFKKLFADFTSNDLEKQKKVISDINDELTQILNKNISSFEELLNISNIETTNNNYITLGELIENILKDFKGINIYSEKHVINNKPIYLIFTIAIILSLIFSFVIFNLLFYVFDKKY